MEQVDLSIIIPVYNVELYIEKCLESIVIQKEIVNEIILIDDGSTDKSGQICDQWAREYSHIKVIHKLNEGVSIARNIGIKEAKGRYITFVDPDDTVVNNLFIEVGALIKEDKIDIICYGFNIVGDNNIKEVGWCEERITDIDYLIDKDLFGYIWNKVYKKSYLEAHGILFNQLMKLYEDEEFNCRAFKYTKKIAYIKKYLYNYIQYNSQQQATKKKYVDILEQNNFKIKAWIELDPVIINKQVIINRCYWAINESISLIDSGLVNKKQYQLIHNRIKESIIWNRFILNSKNNVRNIILKIVVNINNYYLTKLYNKAIHFYINHR